MPTNVIRAQYTDYTAFVNALKTLKERGVRNYEAYGPTNLNELEHLMPPRTEWVRWIAIVCAIVGLVSFWYMCVASSLLFSLITGGKLPVANTPFVVPMYEGTILLGSIGAFIAGLIFARSTFRRLPATYDPRLSEDRYGITVTCEPGTSRDVIQLLRDSGAEEINESEY